MRRLTYVVVLAIALTIGIRTMVQAGEENWKIDSIGIDYQEGGDILLPEEWQGDHCTNLVKRYSLRVESDSLVPYLLNNSWDKWTLGLEGHYSAHKANEKPDYGQDAGFKEIGFNVTIKRHLFNKLFYVGFRAGLSYVDEFPEFENRDWKHGDMNSNIGHSHYLGTWGPMVGKDWHVNKAWSVRTELRGTHTSDPFEPDSGKNFLAGTLGVTYRFK